MKARKAVILCILDGWGSGAGAPDNAIVNAHTPNMDALSVSQPMASLKTSGLAVGLPDGQMGNSEVGHMNIGSGRVVMQSLPRIDAAIEDGSLAAHPSLAQLPDGGAVHIAGLCSDGGVHSHIDHIKALTQICAARNMTIFLHLFTDGRDVPPGSATGYISQMEELCGQYSDMHIATIAGRYYAMDRDERLERTDKAYQAITRGEGANFATAQDALRDAEKEGDEFIIPRVIGGYEGVKEGDAVIFANFRADRMRQIARVFAESRAALGVRRIISMTQYSQALAQDMDVLFPPEELRDTLGEVISARGMKQLRIAETEKYAHVTFFFNGGQEAVYDGEDRSLIPSPDVATYDMQPHMSAPEVAEKMARAIRGREYDLIVANFANTDMVGHTGKYDAAIKAVEAVDDAVGKLWEAAREAGYVLIITADHGNAEDMLDDGGRPHTSHTTNDVPFIVAGAGDVALKPGRLCDIAPTILHLMGIDKPDVMTGDNLAEGG